MKDSAQYMGCDPRGVSPYLTLPNPNHRPPLLSKGPGCDAIPLTVPLDLCDPIGRIGTANELRFPFSPVATVPEITIDENRNASASVNDVRASGELIAMQPEPEPASPELRSQPYFRRGVTSLVRSPPRTRGGARRFELAEARRLGRRSPATRLRPA